MFSDQLITFYIGGVKILTCSVCGEEKQNSEFPRDRSKKTGYKSLCKVCQSVHNKEKYNPKPNPYTLTTISADGESVDAKRCRGCDTIKPLTDYFKSAHCLGGVAPRCKLCAGNKQLFRQAKIVKVEIDGEEVDVKECKKCGKLLPLTDYYKMDGKTKRGLGGRRTSCIKCERAYREKLDQDPARRERRLKRSREYTQEYKERRRIVDKLYRERNLEKFKVKDANRWARKKLLRNDLTSEQYDKVLEHFDYKCALTGREDDLTLEHFIPMSTGHGGTYVGNVYPIHSSLNYSKSATNPFEWLQRKDIQEVVTINRWEKLISYLADQNMMSVLQFNIFVDWCFDNPRTIDDLKRDNSDSVMLFVTDSA